MHGCERHSSSRMCHVHTCTHTIYVPSCIKPAVSWCTAVQLQTNTCVADERETYPAWVPPLSRSRLVQKYFLVIEGASPRRPFECASDAAADIVLLVDGSWSIGRTNFRRVRDFLEGLVTPFYIGPNRIQIGGCFLGAGCSRMLSMGFLVSFSSSAWNALTTQR